MKLKLNSKSYADTAEGVIKELKQESRGQKLEMSTSKIRNLLSMVSVLYTDALHTKGETLSEDIQGQVQYLKMRMAYEAGREKSVKAFISKAGLMDFVSQIGDVKKRLILFCRYMEALVAYHKYYGGE